MVEAGVSQDQRLVRPERPTARQLAKVGVEIMDRNRIWLRCSNCSTVWSPTIHRSGKMSRGYWKCPRGCNCQQVGVELPEPLN
jgi:hypothetical protein